MPAPPFARLQARAPSRPAAHTLCCAAAGPWRTEAAGPAPPSTPAAGEGLSQLGAAVSNGQAAQMGTCCTQQATWSPRKGAGLAPLSACGSPRFGCQVRREGAQAAEQPWAADCSLDHTHQRRLTPLLQLQMHYIAGQLSTCHPPQQDPPHGPPPAHTPTCAASAHCCRFGCWAAEHIPT